MSDGKSKFKVGDRVRVLRHRNWHGDELGPDYGIAEGTIVRLAAIDEGMSHGELTMFAVEDLGDGYYWIVRSDDIEPVNSSPIRTVTRREIVPGSYGAVEVDDEFARAVIWMYGDNAADKFREAAHLFNQLAEVLEDNSKAEPRAAA